MTTLSTLPRYKVDDKYEVEYDPDDNDYPTFVYRHGKPWAKHDDLFTMNFHAAMHYRILELTTKIRELNALLETKQP